MIDARIIERAFDTGRVQRLCRDEKLFAAFKTAGIIREAKLASTQHCDDCLVFHSAERAGRDLWRVSCTAADRFVRDHDLRQWRVVASDLIDFLRMHLNLDEMPDERVPGRLWYLGRHASSGGGFPLWLIRGCGEPSTLELAYSSLNSRSPKERGIIVSVSRHASDMRWPLGTATVRLSDVLIVGGEDTAIDRATLNRLAPPGKSPRRGPGRPLKNDFDTNGTFHKRVRSGEACQPHIGEEASELRDLQVRIYGEERAHVADYIEEQIRPDYTLWAAAGFSRDCPFP